MLTNIYHDILYPKNFSFIMTETGSNTRRSSRRKQVDIRPESLMQFAFDTSEDDQTKSKSLFVYCIYLLLCKWCFLGKCSAKAKLPPPPSFTKSLVSGPKRKGKPIEIALPKKPRKPLAEINHRAITRPLVEDETDELAEIRFSNLDNDTENTVEPNITNGQEIVELPDVTEAITGEISMHEEQEVIDDPPEPDDVAEQLIQPEIQYEIEHEDTELHEDPEAEMLGEDNEEDNVDLPQRQLFDHGQTNDFQKEILERLERIENRQSNNRQISKDINDLKRKFSEFKVFDVFTLFYSFSEMFGTMITKINRLQSDVEEIKNKNPPFIGDEFQVLHCDSVDDIKTLEASVATNLRFRNNFVRIN